MLNELLQRHPELSSCKDSLIHAREAIIHCYERKGKLLLCGNGGSASDCDHIVGELCKGFLSRRALPEKQKAKMKDASPTLSDETLSKLQQGLPAISLPSIAPLNAAFANDVDADLIYAQSVLALGKRGDCLLAISTSGNSKNVIEACRVARALGLSVIALTGEGGGQLRALADICICVPERETYRVQELHLPVYHALCASIERHFWG